MAWQRDWLRATDIDIELKRDKQRLFDHGASGPYKRAITEAVALESRRLNT